MQSLKGKRKKSQRLPRRRALGTGSRSLCLAAMLCMSWCLAEVTVAVLVGAVAVGALYQLMLVKRLKKGPKAGL